MPGKAFQDSSHVLELCCEQEAAPVSCCSLGAGEQSLAGGVERGVPEGQECPGKGAQAAFGRALMSSVPLESGLSSCLACRARAVLREEMGCVKGSRAGAIHTCAQKTAACS